MKFKSRRPFDSDIISMMNLILNDLYENTEYWGQSEDGLEGIVKPITPEDDPKWSNYNFINTNYSTINQVIIPYMKKLFNNNEFKLKECFNFPIPNKNKRTNDFKEDEYNPNKCFFDLMWLMRKELFGHNSEIKDDIISIINKTRKKGSNLENYLVKSLNSVGIISENLSGSGKLSDLNGTDISLILDNKKHKAQVKPLISIYKKNDNYLVKSLMVGTKNYTDQNLLIFAKEIEINKIYEYWIFENPKDKINKINISIYSIDKKYLKYVLKYDNGEVKIKNINN